MELKSGNLWFCSDAKNCEMFSVWFELRSEVFHFPRRCDKAAKSYQEPFSTLVSSRAEARDRQRVKVKTHERMKRRERGGKNSLRA